MGNLFSVLQRIGKSFMLPIAVLPAAGLLLGISSSMGGFGDLPQWLNSLMLIMNSVSGIIFANLPIIFAMGIALGMAKKEKGVATLSSAIAFLVMHATICAMLTINGQILSDGSIAKEVLPGMIAQNCGINTLQMGVFGGIVVGIGVAYLHNRFYMTELPDIISFFGGTRFVPIVCTFAYMLAGIVMYYVWPSVQMGIYSLGRTVADSGYYGTLIFGIIKRALIPIGLHHIFYIPFWHTSLGGTMEVAGRMVEGGQNIFFAQLADAQNIEHFSVEAARYFSGEYIFMIFGLPGAALAMYRAAKPEKRKVVGGLLLSAALTSILTGITEPVEFSFIFAAPILYVAQTLLAGSAYVVAQMLNVAVAVTFSAGLLDLIFLGILPGNAKTSWMMLIPAGIAYFCIYYFVFYFLITKLNLPTPGREEGEDTKLYTRADVKAKYTEGNDESAVLCRALGGKVNIESLDCCATRLRLNVYHPEKLDETAIKHCGAKAVLKDGNAIQIIFGPKVTIVKAKLETYIEQTQDDAVDSIQPVVKDAGVAKILKGKTVVGGVAVAKLVVLEKHPEIVKRNVIDTNSEVTRFSDTMKMVEADFDAEIGVADSNSADILRAQQMMLQDKKFANMVVGKITEMKVCAESAVMLTGKQLAEEFRKMDSAYMQARSEDMEQIARRVADKLLGFRSEHEYRENVILMAEEFSPAQLSLLDKTFVKGLVAHRGNISSHTAILAGNYGIPYLVGVEPNSAYNGAVVILDADAGYLNLSPDATALACANAKLKEKLALVTESGVTKMKVYANISGAEDVEQALKNNADGVGLFRTEFLFMNCNSAPDEEKQYEIYKQVLQEMGDRPVIIRTIDIGTDKPAPCLDLPKEENPALGLRGVRVSLAYKEMFRVQLRALLRAACFGNAHIMFPMITSVNEIQLIKEQVQLAAEELKTKQIAYKLPKLGIMVETPAAAVCSEELGRYVDFLSIGTNDLTQYTLALDRQAEGLDDYYNPHHEAVLQLIKMTIEGGHKNGIPVGVCGQLGSDVQIIPDLVKAGLDEVSVAVAKIPQVRHAVMNAEMEQSKKVVNVGDMQMLSPVDGEIVTMEAIPDAAFAQGVLGPCFGVKPNCGKICAPVKGVVTHVAETGHAVSIAADEGQEVLVHVGINTVNLNGNGFKVSAQKGQRVEAGELLAEIDLDAVTNAGYNPMVITVKLNSDENVETLGSGGEGNTFSYTVKDTVGIHVRPAGELVSLIKDLDCMVKVIHGDKTANGKSVIEWMQLGVAKGGNLQVYAEGKDADKALQLLKDYMLRKM